MHICQDEITAVMAAFGSLTGIRWVWWKIKGICGKPCKSTHEHHED